MSTVRFDGAEAPIESFACPACGDSQGKLRVLTALDTQSHSDLRHSVFRCEACRSMIYHPFPEIDYRQHTGGLVLRDYLEMNASIDSVAFNLFRVIPPDKRGRLLDVGCGFGFALGVVQTVASWEVKGFEPSQYGAAGREQLKLNIVNEFAEMNTDPSDVYDVVHCSEVVEHIHDPHHFLAILASYLSPDGVLVLTTPNPERIVEGANESTLLALLSPGAHTILFSDTALSTLLKRAGLVHLSVDKSPNSALYYASRKPLRFQKVEGLSSTLLHYLNSAIDHAKPGSSLEIGLRYRLFRGAVDQGKYELAERAFVPTLAEAHPQLHDVKTLQDFADRWPLCIPASTYYYAMILLIHRADYSGAVTHFLAARQLCRAKLDLAPSISLIEADLFWRSVFHKALAERYLGDDRAATETLRAFIAGAAHPPIPQDLRQSVEDLTNSLLDSQDLSGLCAPPVATP